MHEHGMAGDVVHLLIDRQRERGAGAIRRVTLQVSELSATTQEALQLAFDHACEEHGIPAFELALVKEGLLGRCEPCGRTVEADEALQCRACGSPVKLTGDETLLLLDCEFEGRGPRQDDDESAS